MRILPPVSRLPTKPIVRRHWPKQAGYQAYRSCLRWEFGFSCAFCLLHEADFVAGGAEGAGLMQVEHFVRAGQNADEANSYENLFYVCRLCNLARGCLPVVASNGARLLNPCDFAWGDHFHFEGDRLVVNEPDDLNASYTADAYDLNDPRKIAARRLRRSTIKSFLEVLIESRILEERLLDQAVNSSDQPIESEIFKNLEAAKTLRRIIYLVIEKLTRFSAIPEDASASCLCEAAERRELPEWLEAQVLDLAEQPPHLTAPA
jgi:hypothetical protein